MRTILEIVRDSAAWAAGIGALAMSWAGAREMRRGHAHPGPSVGPVGASGGLDSRGGSRGWVRAGQAVRGVLSAPSAGRHSAGGRRWSLWAVFHRGQRRVGDMGVSATVIVYNVRREAVRMLRRRGTIPTIATLVWAEGVLAA